MLTGSLRPLRPHQVSALDELRNAIRSGSRRTVLQAPTGMGKTVLGAHMVSGIRERSKRVVFCVPSIGLVDQTFERFVENGINPSDMGVIQANHTWRRPHAPIQIATPQTLTRRRRPITDVVIVDECHLQFDMYYKWMEDNPGLFIGLSATPWAKGMGKHWDRLVKTTSISELINMGYLSPFRVFAPSHPDLSGVKEVAGDFHEGQLADTMNRPTLVGDIVQNWIENGEDRPTLCFATGCDHARSIYERFTEFGISAAYVDADTPREERELIGKRLGAGDVKVVVNIGTLTTGIDWDVRCLILARPTKSPMLHVQIIGRGLRTADGKTDCLIFDHGDTHERLGLVTDIDFDELHDGTKKATDKAKAKNESTPMPRCCTGCAALMPAGVRRCGACGTTIPLKINIDQVEGELKEFTGKSGKKTSKPKKKREALAEQPKEVIYAQLLGIAEERGRKPGWAAHKYREIFEVWPRGMDSVQATFATNEVRRFVRSRDIAFAKGVKSGGAHAD